VPVTTQLRPSQRAIQRAVAFACEGAPPLAGRCTFHRRPVVPRLLIPLRPPFRHGAQKVDSTGDAAILEAVRKRDWEQLGVLLGVYESELGKVLATWSSLPRHIRIAVATLIAS